MNPTKKKWLPRWLTYCIIVPIAGISLVAGLMVLLNIIKLVSVLYFNYPISSAPQEVETFLYYSIGLVIGSGLFAGVVIYSFIWLYKYIKNFQGVHDDTIPQNSNDV